MQRVSYTVRNEDVNVCPPKGGFPLERFRDFIERIVREDPILPSELKELVGFLCDDDLIESLGRADRRLVKDRIRPAVNSWLQQQGKRRREEKAALAAAN
ncbi:MAG: hypothetical protein RDU25_03535 [Patescibacteria group bacterium]|nr:hypothetical protein [Patescibacteria group bacterium]